MKYNKGFTLIEFLIIVAIICILVAIIVPQLARGMANRPSSDRIQQEMQEAILEEGTRQTGMPAIKNFRERKILKDIIEMRDQASLLTYTYLFVPMTGELKFVCNSIGYGIPATTQYTNPQKLARYADTPSTGNVTLPQADPNGLFSGDTDGTWVLCKDPASDKVAPVLMEPDIIVSQFKLK